LNRAFWAEHWLKKGSGEWGGSTEWGVERGREEEREKGGGFDEFLSSIEIHNFNAVQLSK
jgi:hypothetical protein